MEKIKVVFAVLLTILICFNMFALILNFSHSQKESIVIGKFPPMTNETRQKQLEIVFAGVRNGG